MKILVAYASKHGATAKAAGLLAEKLPSGVVLQNLAEVQPDPVGFDVVVLGGAVYAGTLPKALKQYCGRYGKEPETKKLGLFVCCSEASPKWQEFLQANLPKTLLEHACVTASFGGEFKPGEMGLFEKMVLKVVAKANGGQLPDIQLDSTAIEQFARALGE